MSSAWRRPWVLLSVPAFPVVLLALSVWSDLRQFDQKAPFLETRGAVASVDCENHGNYQVTFAVDGRQLSRGAGNLYLKADCRSLAVGQGVPVWYSAQDPAYASFVSPERARSYMKSELVTLFVLAYPLLVGFLFVVTRLFPPKGKAA